MQSELERCSSSSYNPVLPGVNVDEFDTFSKGILYKLEVF